MFSFAQKTLGDFFKKKPKEESTICVCVVTSYSVIGSVVRVFNREGAVASPVVLFSCEEKTSVRHTIDDIEVERVVVANSKKVLEKCRAFQGVFDRVVYVIGEPWATSSVRSLHIERAKPFKVTQKTVEEAVARDMKLFESEIEREFYGESVAIIETAKPVINVNGYRVSSAHDVTAKTVDIQSVVSLAPGRFIEELVDVFSDVFHHANISFVTMNTAQQLLVNPKGKAAIVTLGGTASTISLIDHGVVAETVSIPSGLLGFEENIMGSFEVHQSQIMRVMQFANDEHFLQHHRDLYYLRIKSAYQDLGEGISKGILYLKQVSVIPQPVYVIGNPAWILTLEELLKSDIGYEVMIPGVAMLDERIMYAHTAPVRNVVLSLAILRAVDSKS